MQVKLAFKRKGAMGTASEERVDVGLSGPVDLMNTIISRVRLVLKEDGDGAWEEI